MQLNIKLTYFKQLNYLPAIKGHVIIYQLGGGWGLGNYRGLHENILPKMGGGGVKISFIHRGGGHKYDFHFLFWLLGVDPPDSLWVS